MNYIVHLVILFLSLLLKVSLICLPNYKVKVMVFLYWRINCWIFYKYPLTLSLNEFCLTYIYCNCTWFDTQYTLFYNFLPRTGSINLNYLLDRVSLSSHETLTPHICIYLSRLVLCQKLLNIWKFIVWNSNIQLRKLIFLLQILITSRNYLLHASI